MQSTPEWISGEREAELTPSFPGNVAFPDLALQHKILSPEHDTRVIDDLRTFEKDVEDFIRAWHETKDESNCYVGFDGLPGAGKTTLMEKLRDICARLGINLHENGVDNFITTDRDDPLRHEMTRDPEIFKQRYYSRTAVRKLLTTIQQVNGHGTVISFNEMYDRSIGKVKPGTVTIPAGRKIVLLEGVNAIPFIQELEAKHGATTLKVHVYANPHIAMDRAIQRDARNGSRKAAEAYTMRAAEYEHLVEPVNIRNPKMADIIYLQD